MQAYFGKVPTHGDFVRHNAAGGAVRALDEWLQSGIFAARDRIKPALKAAHEDGRRFGFFFAPRDVEQILAGVMGASRDSVGRRYPFLIASEAAATAFDVRRIAELPVRYRAFFEEAAEVVGRATSGVLEHTELAAQIEPLGGLAGGEAERAAFARYLQKESLPSFWRRLWGHPHDSRKYLLFKNLIDILQPLSGGVPASFPLVLRFPLCGDGRTSDYDVSFWLEVVLRLLKYPELQPTFFWTLAQGTSAAGASLLLALRPPSARMLGYLLQADVTDDTLCELERMGAHNAALAALSIPTHYGRLLEDDRLTLWDFLRRL